MAVCVPGLKMWMFGVDMAASSRGDEASVLHAQGGVF
jgi:hypothetical protein